MIEKFQKLITDYAYNNNFYCRFNFDGYVDEIESINGSIFYGTGFTLVIHYKLNVNRLFCRFALQQNPYIEYSPYDVLNYIDNNFYCLSFDYVENDKDLEICINYIFSVVDKYYEKILELSYSKNMEHIKGIFAKDFDKYYKGNVFYNENIIDEYKEILFQEYYKFDNKRYFTSEYKYFIEGKHEKAMEKYLKNKDNLCNYELKILEYLQKNERCVVTIDNIEKISKYVFYKQKVFNILILIKFLCLVFGVALSSCLCFAIYTVIYYFFILIIKGQGTDVNRYVIAALSIVPGIVMTFKLRKEWYDMFAVPNDLESNGKLSKTERNLLLLYVALSFVIMIINIKIM